jgi:hypothetical protein
MTFGDLSDDKPETTKSEVTSIYDKLTMPNKSAKHLYQSVIKEEDLEESGIRSETLTYS